MGNQNDTSCAIWQPEDTLYLRVPDPAFWTSVCLCYDKVIVCSDTVPSVELLTYIASLPKSDVPTVDLTNTRNFLNMLVVLIREGAVDIRTLPHVTNRAHSVTEAMEFLRFLMEKATPGVDGNVGFLSYTVSRREGHPVVCESESTAPFKASDSQRHIEHLHALLTQSTICQLGLPQVKTVHVDDLLETRTALRDELLEFRTGIRKLTWLLHQQVKDQDDLTEIRQEADVLVHTIIEGAVMSLEHRMRQHENKRIRRMLFGTGKVLVDAAKMFLPGGWQEKLVSGGKTLLQTATEMSSSKPPEDQIATYLYKLKRRLKP